MGFEETEKQHCHDSAVLFFCMSAGEWSVENGEQ